MLIAKNPDSLFSASEETDIQAIICAVSSSVMLNDEPATSSIVVAVVVTSVRPTDSKSTQRSRALDEVGVLLEDVELLEV
jgi:hypothetical protein